MAKNQSQQAPFSDLRCFPVPLDTFSIGDTRNNIGAKDRRAVLDNRHIPPGRCSRFPRFFSLPGGKESSELILLGLSVTATVGAHRGVFYTKTIFIIASIPRCLPLATVGALVLPGVDFEILLLEVVVAAGGLGMSAMETFPGRFDFAHRPKAFLETAGLDNVIKVAKMVANIEIVKQVAEAA